MSAAERNTIKQIVLRDATFFAVAVAITSFTTYVELNAFDASLRGNSGVADERGIVDTGFIATSSLYSFVRDHREWNDFLALLNTMTCVLLPLLYLAYVTLWIGDYDLSFRYLAAQVLRSVCGWLTYLPSSSEYLLSWNDIPHIWQKQLKDNKDIAIENTSDEPFVSFFSGHVATMIICANHLYLHGHRNLGILFHVFNVLQIIRLLATRGHYSIDIIIAWYVASHVSRSAGRLGWYYSRGRTLRDWAPSNIRQVFERIVGIEGDRRSSRYLRLVEKKELQDALMEVAGEEADIAGHSCLDSDVLATALKLAVERTLLRDKHTDGTDSSEVREKKQKEG